jgi:hypothetical protein
MVGRRFVLLQHFQSSGDHFDLMLEDGDHLVTWRLPHVPESGIAVSADQSFNHRLAYLDYEGPISGDRGHVVRRDRGTFKVLEWQPQSVRVEVHGSLLRGELRVTADESSTEAWQLLYLARD